MGHYKMGPVPAGADDRWKTAQHSPAGSKAAMQEPQTGGGCRQGASAISAGETFRVPRPHRQG